MRWLRPRLGQALFGPAAILGVVTGCGWFLLSGFAAFPPRPTDPAWAWLLFAFTSGAAVLAVVLVLVEVVVRSVRAGWPAATAIPRIRARVWVLPKDSVSGGLKPSGELDTSMIPEAPRANLTADEAVRGWQTERNRLNHLLAEAQARRVEAVVETRRVHQRYRDAEADLTEQRDSALAEAQAARERAAALQAHVEMATVKARVDQQGVVAIESSLQAARGP